MAAPSVEEQRLEKDKLDAEIWRKLAGVGKIKGANFEHFLHVTWQFARWKTANYFVLAHFFPNEEPQNRNKRLITK